MAIAIYIVVGLLLIAVAAFVIGLVFYRARMQHYVFAHQILPTEVFARPREMLAPMVSEKGFRTEGRQHLLQFWNAASEGFSGSDLVPADSLTYNMVVLGHPNSTAFLIELPPPEKKTEAHFVLIVFDAPGLCVGKIRQLRYFVLENYGRPSDPRKTNLGEWIPKGTGLKYVDHGAGPPPEKKAFMDCVQEVIAKSGSQPQPQRT